MNVGSLSTVERAFQLARSGCYRSVRDINKKLKAEKCEGVDAHLTGSLNRQLRAAIEQSRLPEPQTAGQS